MRQVLGIVLLVGTASCVRAPATPGPAALSADEEVHKVAQTYLDALMGASDDPGRELLLGGATATAKLFTLENWRIEKKDAPRHEEAEVSLAVTLMNELDEATRGAMSALMASGGAAESTTVEQITPALAAELMGPTRASAERLTAALPVMGYVLRVGKSVYWSPKNPARALLASAGGGRYTLDVHRFEIETTEGPRKVPRRWPLRVLRFKTAQLDTGWKVLPASDWNAE